MYELFNAELHFLRRGQNVSRLTGKVALVTGASKGIGAGQEAGDAADPGAGHRVRAGHALQLHQDDQALELGSLHVIAGSGAEIQGYARGDRTTPRQIQSEV